mmetsp:Transcript_2558/g.3939  ORF Transcript_2558/g.3939 Transcript_2558/m.3939 type:complete len:381 (+) Transcript_2558:60-1202(+)
MTSETLAQFGGRRSTLRPNIEFVLLRTLPLLLLIILSLLVRQVLLELGFIDLLARVTCERGASTTSTCSLLGSRAAFRASRRLLQVAIVELRLKRLVIFRRGHRLGKAASHWHVLEDSSGGFTRWLRSFFTFLLMFSFLLLAVLTVVLILVSNTRADLVAVLLAPVLLLQDLQSISSLLAESLQVFKWNALDRVELAHAMAHNLNPLLVGMDYVIAQVLHFLLDRLVLGSLAIFLSFIKDAPVSLESNVLSDLDVLLCSLELFELLLQVLNKVLGECGLGTGSVLAHSASRLLRPQIQVLHNFILGDVVLINFFLVFAVVAVNVLDLAAKLSFPLLLGDLESSGETTSFFAEEFGNPRLRSVLNLILDQSSHLGNLVLRI